MNFLSPEIEAWYKDRELTCLVRPTISCGIFQECDYTEERPVMFTNSNLSKSQKS